MARAGRSPGRRATNERENVRDANSVNYTSDERERARAGRSRAGGTQKEEGRDKQATCTCDARAAATGYSSLRRARDALSCCCRAWRRAASTTSWRKRMRWAGV